MLVATLVTLTVCRVTRVIKRGYGSGVLGWMTAYREDITV